MLRPIGLKSLLRTLRRKMGRSKPLIGFGFHDGIFDIYDGGTPADNDPILNDPNQSVERLAEDGNTDPISNTFRGLLPDGVDGTIPGPERRTCSWRKSPRKVLSLILPIQTNRLLQLCIDGDTQ